MSTKKGEETTRRVRFRSIFIPENQLRQDDPKIPQIAQSMKDDGQYMPVLVTEGGPEGFDFTLNEGFRRCAAFKLNGWEDRDIEVKVLAKKKPVDRVITNWVANMEREPISFLDQCEGIGNLVDGSYPVLPGEKATPLERYEVAQRLRLTTGQVSRMYRVFKNLDPDVASLARKVPEHLAPVPSSLLIAIAKIDGEGADEAQRQEDRARKQGKILTSWIEKKKKLEEEGRVRSVRSDKGTSKKNGKKHEEPANVGVVAPEKRVQHAVYRNDKDRSYSVEDYVTVLAKKQKSIVKERNIAVKRPAELSPKEQVIRLTGIIDGMRFMKGEISRLSDLTKEDFDVLNPPEPAASAEAE